MKLPDVLFDELSLHWPDKDSTIVLHPSTAPGTGTRGSNARKYYGALSRLACCVAGKLSALSFSGRDVAKDRLGAHVSLLCSRFTCWFELRQARDPSFYFFGEWFARMFLLRHGKKGLLPSTEPLMDILASLLDISG
jgi:hypothetical protein